MAWKFLDVAKPANKRYREEMLQSINAWWAHFQNKRKNIEAWLEGRASWDLEGFMADHLQTIDERLMWEYGIQPSGGFSLVVTPEDERHLRPLVEAIVAAAPKIATWTFHAYRQPHGWNDTVDIVKDQTGIDPGTISFKAERDEENLINLTFKASAPLSDEILGDVVFMSCEYLLGEEVLDRWIGEMNFADDGSNLKPMSDLANTVAAMIDETRSTMPDRQLATIRDKLDGRDFKAVPQDDSDLTERFDMVEAHTRIPKIWQSAHSDAPFDSCRFSKNDERFCYLKFEGITDKSKLEALESQIHEALMHAGVGCTTGSAIGKQHGYVDVCLSNLDIAIAVLRETCRSAGCPTNSWLQFFDADWAAEWIAIHPDAPTPPGMIEH